jgi:hypothetical protein
MPPLPLYKRTLVICGWTLFLLILFFEFMRIPRSAGSLYDLEIMIKGSSRLMHGQSAYRLEETDEFKSFPLAAPIFYAFDFLPRPQLYFVWALMLLLMFFHSLKMCHLRIFSLVGVATGFSVLQFLIPEIKGGQVNMIVLWLLLSEYSGFIKEGYGLALAMIIKPTNLLFVPFFFAYRRGRGMFVGFAWTMGLFFIVYSVLCGPTVMWKDIQEWLHFLPAAGAKHLFQPDNLGLLAAIGKWFPDVAQFSIPITLAGTIGGYFLGRRARTSDDFILNFGIACWLALVLSPVAWIQNYVFCLPLAATALTKLEWPKPPAILFAIYFALTQLINFTFVGRTLFEASIHAKVILVASFALLASAFQTPPKNPNYFNQ